MRRAEIEQQMREIITEAKKNGVLKNVGPDAKSQITVFYDKNGFPKKIISVVLSVQHNKKVMKGKNISDFRNKLMGWPVYLLSTGNMNPGGVYGQ